MGQFRRRQFLISAAALLAAPLPSFAQIALKVRRIGFLAIVPSASDHGEWLRKAMRKRLVRAGYEEGKNLVIEWRFAEHDAKRLPGLAEELVRLNVELLVAYRNEAIAPAMLATRTIPIVMAVSFLPVENRLVESLEHPGGNVTGSTWWVGPETQGKIFEILKQAVPRATRVAHLLNPTSVNTKFFNDEESNRKMAAAVGLTISNIPMTGPDELTTALNRIAAGKFDALIVESAPVIQSRYPEILAFTLKRKLVTISSSTSHFASGGLIYYGPSLEEIWDRTLNYVDRILHGAKPSELPVENPKRWELLLNAKTARAIGFKPPPEFLVRMDRQVEEWDIE